jgi:hypothetical protein
MRQPTLSATESTLGVQLAHAIFTRDARDLRSLFSTPVTFRAVTPRRFWDAETPVGVADIVLGTWFGPEKQITAVTSVETDTIGDVAKVTYRMAVDVDSTPTVVEQVAYYSEEDGLITHLRLVCSGFRPVPATAREEP